MALKKVERKDCDDAAKRVGLPADRKSAWST